jgi:phosphohistidine phosphatase
MKMIYVIRHAKSSWDDLGLNDFKRPLNERGKKDVPRMASRLKEQNIVVDLILSSPAERAFATSKVMASALTYAQKDIKTDPRIYLAAESTLLAVLREIDDAHTNVMIVGHNPGLTEFINQLMSLSMGAIPTCGVVAAKLTIASWKELGWGCGRQEFFYSPKQ